MKTGAGFDGLISRAAYVAEHYCTRRITAVPPSVAPAFMMMESTLTEPSAAAPKL
jgi:hypothetical protein